MAFKSNVPYTPPKVFPPTPEQQAIVDAARSTKDNTMLSRQSGGSAGTQSYSNSLLGQAG